MDERRVNNNTVKNLELENRLLREVIEGLVCQIVQLHMKFRRSLYRDDME